MMQFGHDTRRRWLVLGMGLLVTALSANCGSAAEHSLVVDPGTFVSMPADMETARVPGSAHGSGRIGPRIVLRFPQDNSVFATGENVKVHLEFLPADDGSAPNMTTLRVTVRKGWLGKDITEMVKPYIEGTAVRVPAVDFSGHSGRFRFDISISDFEERVSEARLRVRIDA